MMEQRQKGIVGSTSKLSPRPRNVDISDLDSLRSSTSAPEERAKRQIADFLDQKSSRLVQVLRQCRLLAMLS